LKCYNFLWVQRRHNCSPAVSFANCVMTLYLLKLHLQMFLSIPITQKCQIVSCDTCRKWAICCIWRILSCYLSELYILQCTHVSKGYFLQKIKIMMQKLIKATSMLVSEAAH
jgi:hypothetical protein